MSDDETTSRIDPVEARIRLDQAYHVATWGEGYVDEWPIEDDLTLPDPPATGDLQIAILNGGVIWQIGDEPYLDPEGGRS